MHEDVLKDHIKEPIKLKSLHGMESNFLHFLQSYTVICHIGHICKKKGNLRKAKKPDKSQPWLEMSEMF
jgi:hypothetical protein